MAGFDKQGTHINHCDFPIYRELKNSAVNTYKNFAILQLSIDNDALKREYIPRIEKHNDQFIRNTLPDSGFDILVPTNELFDKHFTTKFIDMGIKTEMIYCDVETDFLSTCAYNVHPRSSISKTPLMLANHTGIIDSGYRGSLIGAFRYLPSATANSGYTVDKYTRLLQVCHPTLCPIYVIIIDSNELTSSQRGSGGFGSTN
jgi:dUTP pyrophosphatase